MSEENVEIARRIFPTPFDMVAVFGNADVMAALRHTTEPFVHPDFETAGDPNFIAMGPDTGVGDGPRGLFAKGFDGFATFWRDWLSAFEVWNVGHADLTEVDANRVLATYDVHARSKTAQVDMHFHAAHLMAFRDEKLARVELFLNHVDALEAAGLSE
jgi:hypothetical protein